MSGNVVLVLDLPSTVLGLHLFENEDEAEDEREAKVRFMGNVSLSQRNW